MGVPYDRFTFSFIAKIHEYDFIEMDNIEREEIVDEFMIRSFNSFRKNCKYDFFTTRNDVDRVFNVEVLDEDIDEIIDIVSEGMVVQFLKPFVYRQENLENVLNTRDFTTYSPAELLLRISNVYSKAQSDYTQMIREYSFNHGDLKELHI